MCDHKVSIEALLDFVDDGKTGILAYYKYIIKCKLCDTVFLRDVSTENDLLYFDSKEAAFDHLDKTFGDDCGDNYRFAFLQGNGKELESYAVAFENGCCGSYDRLVVVGGKKAILGCNYGH